MGSLYVFASKHEHKENPIFLKLLYHMIHYKFVLFNAFATLATRAPKREAIVNSL
jgi:hypothetical protein